MKHRALLLAILLGSLPSVCKADSAANSGITNAYDLASLSSVVSHENTVFTGSITNTDIPSLVGAAGVVTHGITLLGSNLYGAAGEFQASEPALLALLGTGITALAGLVHRRSRKQA